MRVDRRFPLVIAGMLAGLLAALSIAGPAVADPGDDEGGSVTLREQLDTAAKGYLDAKAKLDASKVRQQELTSQLATVEVDLATQSEAVQQIAAAAYRFGGMGMGELSGALGSESPDVFLDRMSLINVVAANQDDVVHELAVTRDAVTEAKAAIEVEISQQQTQLAEMAKRKEAAEKALRVAGGGQSTSGFSATSAQAAPAPRNANGTWPAESCASPTRPPTAASRPARCMP